MATAPIGRNSPNCDTTSRIPIGSDQRPAASDGLVFGVMRCGIGEWEHPRQ
jgi:hypothetical protein